MDRVPSDPLRLGMANPGPTAVYLNCTIKERWQSYFLECTWTAITSYATLTAVACHWKQKQESGGGKDRNLGKENNWNRNDEQRGRLERMTIRNNRGVYRQQKNWKHWTRAGKTRVNYVSAAALISRCSTYAFKKVGCIRELLYTGLAGSRVSLCSSCVWTSRVARQSSARLEFYGLTQINSSYHGTSQYERLRPYSLLGDTHVSREIKHI